MIPSYIDKSKIPHKPGVYIYKDSSGKILYVGKAIDLYHRVASYFNDRQASPKTVALVAKIADLDTIIVESELEALILEANLIKKYLPPYNIKLTDDKDYLYVKVTKETYPRILTARKTELADASKYFGPFPSAQVIRTTLKRLRRIFPWCANPESKGRPCFYYHLGLCPGPCVGKITPSDYQQNIKRFIKFMDGKKSELVEELTMEMEQSAKDLQFEKATVLKKIISGIGYLTQSNKTQLYLDNPNFVEDQNHLAMEQLQKDLGLPELPERIECFDISNIQGQQAVGSMVVLTNGDIDKSQYRKFKIAITGKPNDVGMHQEMMQRRLRHPEWPYPQVMIIDGGRGQVRAAKAELDKKGLSIPVYGLAKRLEWLYDPEEEIIKLSKSSLSLRLLQKIRDEAHRFAITFHRQLRSKNVYNEGL